MMCQLLVWIATGKHLHSNITGKQTLNFQGSRSVKGFRLGDKRSTQKKCATLIVHFSQLYSIVGFIMMALKVC